MHRCIAAGKTLPDSADSRFTREDEYSHKILTNLLHLDFLFKMLLNGLMTDEINRKVINIFSKHKKSLPSEHDEKIKFFAGFNYVKLTRDNNGKIFNDKHLEKYAQKCHYIVRVMKNIDGETVLYNYDVSNDRLFEFINAFENNTLNGTIIEIDKYFPEDLA